MGNTRKLHSYVLFQVLIRIKGFDEDQNVGFVTYRTM